MHCESFNTYYRDDSHWTTYGASIYLVHALNTIGFDFDFDALRDNFVMHEGLRGGDLGAKIDRPGERIREIKDPLAASRLVYGNDVRNTGAIRLFRNEYALSAERVLILHDSFGVWMTALASQIFAEALFVHTPHLDRDFLQKNPFDRVLFVQAERFFVAKPKNAYDWRSAIEDVEQLQKGRSTFSEFSAALSSKVKHCSEKIA